MTRKRLKKLLMSKGCSRNYAEMYVRYAGSRKPTVAYKTLWSFWKYCREHYLEWLTIAEREDPDEDLYETRMESCERDIAYAQEHITEEIKRAEEKTQFMKELCDSLRESFGEDDGSTS